MQVKWERMCLGLLARRYVERTGQWKTSAATSHLSPVQSLCSRLTH